MLLLQLHYRDSSDIRKAYTREIPDRRHWCGPQRERNRQESTLHTQQA